MSAAQNGLEPNRRPLPDGDWLDCLYQARLRLAAVEYALSNSIDGIDQLDSDATGGFIFILRDVAGAIRRVEDAIDARQSRAAQ